MCCTELFQVRSDMTLEKQKLHWRIFLVHWKTISEVLQVICQRVHGVDLASKISRSQSDRASVGCSRKYLSSFQRYGWCILFLKPIMCCIKIFICKIPVTKAVNICRAVTSLVFPFEMRWSLTRYLIKQIKLHLASI